MISADFPILPGRALAQWGERICIARKARGLNQRDLARLAGVAPSTIAALEKGHPGVALGTLAKALDAMNLLPEMDELLRPERDAQITEYATRRLKGAR